MSTATFDIVLDAELKATSGRTVVSGLDGGLPSSLGSKGGCEAYTPRLRTTYTVYKRPHIDILVY